MLFTNMLRPRPSYSHQSRKLRPWYYLQSRNWRPCYDNQSRNWRPCYNNKSRDWRPCYNNQSCQLQLCYNIQSRQLRPLDDRLLLVKEVTDDSDDQSDDNWRHEYVRRDWSDDSRRDFFAKKKIFLASCLSCWATKTTVSKSIRTKIESKIKILFRLWYLQKYFKILKKIKKYQNNYFDCSTSKKDLTKSLYKSNNKIELKQFNCFGTIAYQ